MDTLLQSKIYIKVEQMSNIIVMYYIKYVSFMFEFLRFLHLKLKLFVQRNVARDELDKLFASILILFIMYLSCHEVEIKLILISTCEFIQSLVCAQWTT